MEGPSLYLAAQQLAPFKGKVVADVSGSTTTIDIARLEKKKVKDIFSWGKHLVFQFDTFAIRIHFLMFGTFAASVKGKSVTGDYKKKDRQPRLALVFPNGRIEMYSCSVRALETKTAKKTYDFSVNLMSSEWDGRKALKNVLATPDRQIADVLLDQNVFAGLGNIIKNEILFLAKTRPTALVQEIPRPTLKKLVGLAKDFSLQFYAWRKKFELRKNLKVHRKRICPICGGQLQREKTGTQERWSYYCPVDQK